MEETNLFTDHPETVVLTINLILISFAYTILYPNLVQGDWRKLAKLDILLTGLALLVAGLIYWSSGIIFNLFGFSVGWFLFALISFMLMEAIPAYLYIKKYDIDFND